VNGEVSNSPQPTAGERKNEPNYDMHDDCEEDLRRWPKLRPVLHDCENTIRLAYDAADTHATKYLRMHKVVVLVAALCGMLAVLFAILQLPTLDYRVDHSGQPDPPNILGFNIKLGEVLAATAAGAAVVLGLIAFASKWLLERERAECYRFLKFNFLLRPELWNQYPGERKKWLQDRIKPIRNLNRKELRRWAEGEDEVVEVVPSDVPEGVDEAILKDLIRYYRTKRLNYQLRYFAAQADRRRSWDRITSFAPHVLFFLSVLAALGHFSYDLLPGGEAEMVTLTLVMFAACFPVIGAAIRTVRTAHEFSRNALRFKAVSHELNQLTDDLQQSTDPREELRVLRGVEKALEAERREWRRLMKEAEWFG
jgi:hypothetical protein